MSFRPFITILRELEMLNKTNQKPNNAEAFQTSAPWDEFNSLIIMKNDMAIIIFVTTREQLSIG